METNLQRTLERTIIDVLLLIAAFLVPWWAVFLLASAFFFRFNHFVELFFVALILDLLYAIPREHFGDFQFILSAGSVFLYVILAYVKRRLRF